MATPLDTIDKKLQSLEETIDKVCMIGLSYFDVKNNLLKQSMLAGKVISYDKEMGITLELLSSRESKKESPLNNSPAANFILPAELSCWFVAPQGDYHTSEVNNNGEQVKITDPDYLVTWDICQTQSNEQDSGSESISDSEQQWWKWYPRTQSPQIGQ
jgi:hypothetical protein